jgi:hypothetical protein
MNQGCAAKTAQPSFLCGLKKIIDRDGDLQSDHFRDEEDHDRADDAAAKEQVQQGVTGGCEW